MLGCYSTASNIQLLKTKAVARLHTCSLVGGGGVGSSVVGVGVVVVVVGGGGSSSSSSRSRS
eukprot:10570735-Heterocapsa_arctica.AAC.1